MTVVLDASVVTAALTAHSNYGDWAEGTLRSGALVAPSLLPAEVANALRFSVLAGRVPADLASQAHNQLLTLPIRLVSYAPLGRRIWELRRSVTVYDAWYVALAEALDAELATLDHRLARAHGPRCRFLTP